MRLLGKSLAAFPVLAIATIIVAVHVDPAGAMSNYKPRARDTATEAGCKVESVRRAGRVADSLTFAVTCSPDSPMPGGVVACNAKTCTFEPDSATTADAAR